MLVRVRAQPLSHCTLRPTVRPLLTSHLLASFYNCLPASRPPGLRTKTIFPVGVENLAVKFEHTFKTKQTFSDVWTGNTGLGVGKTLRGSSSSKPCSLVTVTPP